MDSKEKEVLIRVDQKLTDLCKQIDANEIENRQAHEYIIKTMDDWKIHVDGKFTTRNGRMTTQVQECNRRFVNSKIFYWVLSFVVAGLLSLATYVATFSGGSPSHVEPKPHSTQK